MVGGYVVVVAVVSLLVGPLLAWAWPGGRAWRGFVDGLSLSLVGGLCLFHLVPEAVTEGGLASVVAGAIGFLAPALAHRAHGPGSSVWGWAGAAAVLVHSVMDGAALSLPGEAVAVAVVAHQVPVGLGIWSLSRHFGGRDRTAFGALGGVVVATLAGYALGGSITSAIPPGFEGVLEALVAGALLHVVFDGAPESGRGGLKILALAPSGIGPAPALPLEPTHHHAHCREHEHDHGHGAATTRAWSSVGALAGAAGLAALALRAGGSDHIEGSLRTVVALGLEGAPALLLGYVVAGAIAAFVSPGADPAGGGRVVQAARGVVYGLPLPVGACGVLPLYESLVRRGVPLTAAVAFLVATPEIGPDALLLSVPLLGGPLAAARAAAAVGVAVAVAWLVGHATAPRSQRPARVEVVRPRELSRRLADGWRFGAVELVDHTLPWVVLGLLIAGLAEPLVDHGALAAIPAGLQVPLLALVSLPLHVGAAGAMPVAAVLVHKGASAGAALAFLLAGPAANLATFRALARIHGRATAVRFAAALIAAAVFSGWMVDAAGIAAAPVSHTAPVPAAHPLHAAAAVVLVALALASLFRQGARGVVSRLVAPVHGH